MSQSRKPSADINALVDLKVLQESGKAATATSVHPHWCLAWWVNYRVISSDGVLFCIGDYMLKQCFAWMDLVDMSENVANAGVELVLVDEQLERAAVLGTFLDLMYFGYTLEDTPAAKWPPIDVLCDAVVLADKWEAPLAFSRGLAYVEMWSTRNDDPLPAFRIGARFGKNVMMGVMAGRIIEKDLHLRIEDWPVAYAKDIPGGVIWALVKTASELCHSSGHTCARPDRCNPNATKTAARFAHHVKSLRPNPKGT